MIAGPPSRILYGRPTESNFVEGSHYDHRIKAFDTRPRSAIQPRYRLKKAQGEPTVHISHSPCTSTRGRYRIVLVEAKGGYHGEPAARSAAGDARHVDSQDPGSRPPTRVGYFRANSADFERRVAYPAGVALPCPPPIGAPRLDQGEIGNRGEQPPRQVLRANKKWAKAT